MRVLVIDAHHANDPARSNADATVATLQANGCDTELHRIHDLGFGSPMTEAEFGAYRTADPLITPETREAGAAVAGADALVFCYPATMFGVPPVLKNWHERVLVPGVGFRVDHKRRVRPGMTQIRRIGAVTTTPHGRAAVLRARDLGRRTIMRTMRMNCHRFCRPTFVSLPDPVDESSASAAIAVAFRRWR